MGRAPTRLARAAIAGLAVAGACGTARLGSAAQRSGTAAEFRGLSAANDTVVWAAGRGGVYARTLDGGAHWTVQYSDSTPGVSRDGGVLWQLGDTLGYNTVAVPPGGRAWLAGVAGRIASVRVSRR